MDLPIQWGEKPANPDLLGSRFNFLKAQNIKFTIKFRILVP